MSLHGVGVFSHSDVKMKKTMGLNIQQKDIQWTKAQGIVREMRKVQSVFTDVFKAGIPSGKQLGDPLEKMRAVLYLAAQKTRTLANDGRTPTENDDAFNDDAFNTVKALLLLKTDNKLLLEIIELDR